MTCIVIQFTYLLNTSSSGFSETCYIFYMACLIGQLDSVYYLIVCPCTYFPPLLRLVTCPFRMFPSSDYSTFNCWWFGDKHGSATILPCHESDRGGFLASLMGCNWRFLFHPRIGRLPSLEPLLYSSLFSDEYV